MYKILVVEDDVSQNKELCECITQAYPSWKICTAHNFQEAKELLEQSLEMQSYFSLFLLDVQLQDDPCDFGGFVIANSIREQKIYYKSPILFLTAVSEKVSYALSNFHCYNYITKPYSSNEVIDQLRQMMLTGFINIESVLITDINRIKHRIAQNKIYYIEAKSHLIVFYTQNGIISTRETNFERILDELTDNFIQCHKKYIINKNYVSSYDKVNRYLRLNTDSIPVSRTYKEAIESII